MTPLLPLVFVLVAYSEAPYGAFVWDDHALIPEQEVVTKLSPMGEYFDRLFWSDPFSVSRGFYRPLVTLSYALEYQLWDGVPAGFHVTNILLHLMVTGLVFLLIRRVGGGVWAAALGATIFGVAPRLTESVAWISGRTDVMAALFALVALLVWPRRETALARRAVASVALLMGLLSKEVAAAAMVGIVAHELMLLRRTGQPQWRSFLKRMFFVGAPLGLYAVLRVRANRLDVRAVQIEETVGLPFSQRWEAALSSAGHYLRMLLDPWRPETQIGRLGEPSGILMVAGGLALLGGIVTLVRAITREQDRVVVPLVVGGAALGMVLHLVPLPVNILAADRFLYLPLAMLCVAVTPRAEDSLRRRGYEGVMALAVLILASTFLVATRARVAEWSGELSLWRAAASQAGPSDFLPAFQLASHMMDHERWDRALEYLRDAEGRYGQPGNIKIWNNIALTLDRLGRRDEAIELYEQMKAERPENQRTRFNLVMVRLRSGRFDEAQAELAALRGAGADLHTIEQLEALAVSARAEWVGIGAEEAGEPVETTARRAQYFERLGALPEARNAWRKVLEHPVVSGELRERGAGFLVFHGDESEGKRALQILRAEQGGTEQFQHLERVYRERMALE